MGRRTEQMEEQKGTIDTQTKSDVREVKACQIETRVDLQDLGAGYEYEDRRVGQAIEIYEKEILTFVKQNQKLFKHSNYLSIKGYATGLSKRKKRDELDSDITDTNPKSKLNKL